MKELVVSRALLLDAVEKIIATCERPTSKGQRAVPHFFYIKINGYGDKIRLSANNMFRQIEVMLGDVSPHETFCVGVSGVNFFSLLKGISEDQIAIGYESGLTLKTVRSWYSLATLSKDRFPERELIIQKEWQEVNYEDFFDALSRITYCTADVDAARPFTKAVVVTNTHFYCTDGFRLSLFPNRLIRCGRPFLLPIESVKSYTNLFKEKGEQGFVSVDEYKIHFSKRNVYATSTLGSGDIPDHRSVTPDGVAMKVLLTKVPMLKALKRLALFSKALSKRVLPVEIVFSKNEVYLSLDNHDFQNQAREEVECTYDGPTTKISANIKHLYQALKSIKEDSAIIELRGSHYRLVITDEKGEHKNVINPTG